ncbi:MAG: hypothetical protein ABII94_02505 [Patescibacteria group bacterium]
MIKKKTKHLINLLPTQLAKFLIWLYKSTRREILSPIRIYISNKKKIKKYLKQESLKLEIGSSIKKQGWITIDLKKSADLQLNLTKTILFSNNSITEIHSEHFFEHLTIEEIKFCLKECFRILKIGGEISFGVPDFERACKTYLLDENEFYKEKFWLSPNPNWCKSKIDELNFLIYANGYHRFMFDKENGIQRLKEAGFKNCRIRNYNPQKDSKQYDPKIRNGQESLYFIGEKVL